MTMTETLTASSTVDAARLRDAATIAAAAPFARSYCLPALSSARFDGATLTMSDLDVTMTVRLGGAQCEPRLISPKVLRDAAKATKPTKNRPQSVTVTAEPDGATIVGASRATVRCIPAEEYPVIRPVGSDGVYMPGDVVAAMLEVAWAASRDDARPILTGVVWSGTDVAATDSYRLTVRTGLPAGPERSTTAGFDRSPLVPAAGLRVLAKLAGKFGSPVCAWIGERAVTFEAPAYTVTVRLIDGEFPNYPRLIPEPSTDVAEVRLTEDAAAWIKSLRINAAPVRVHFEDDGTVRLSYSMHDVGDGEYVGAGTWADLDGSGGPGMVALNPAYLAEQLQRDGLTFTVRDHLKPVTFRHAGGLGLLMPVRIN